MTDEPDKTRDADTEPASGRTNEEESPQAPEHDDSEGRDRPPSDRGRDPKSPWLGGG